MTNEQSIQRELIASIETGDLEAVRALIEGGVDVNHRGNDPDGETALMRGIAAGQLEMMRLLISAGAEVNCAGKLSGWTALMLAHDSAEMVEVLLAAGADVKARSYACELKEGGRKVRRGGETALHFAAVANNAEVVRKLIAAGSEVEALDWSGCAPLDVALRVGAVTTAAEALVEGGAKLTAERLEAMHSGAYDGGSELRMFPTVDTIELRGREVEGCGVEDGRNKDDGVRCAHCGALTYSRKARICGSCGKALSTMLGVGDDQQELIASERKWAQKLADSFGPTRRTSDPAGWRIDLETGVEPNSPAELIRSAASAEAFRRRRRPGFWLVVMGNIILLGVIGAICSAALGTTPVYALLTMLGLLAVTCLTVWRSSDTICPNCSKNIRICAERHCCNCGKLLGAGRCGECEVRKGVWEVSPPGRRINYCPSCGVWLDSGLLRRWREIGLFG